MRRSVSGLMVLLLLGVAALLAVVVAPTAVRAAEADTAAVAEAEVEGVAEDAALEAAESELDEEEGITADDEDESEADDEAEEEEADASFVEVDSPAATAESTEVLQTQGVVVQPKPVDPAPPAKQSKKQMAKKVKLHMEAAYYGEKLPKAPKQYSVPQYGDPNPRLTAAKAKKAAKAGKPAHPRVFTSNYLSPVPQSHPRVKCYGKGKKEKCFRVARNGQVVGRHVHAGLPRVVAETRSLHAMEKKGFQTAEYDDKLARWKPRRHKRTLSPAAVMSFAEVDAREETEDEDEEEVEDEAEAEEEDEMEEEIDEADEVEEEDEIDEEADAMDEVDEEDAAAEAEAEALDM